MDVLLCKKFYNIVYEKNIWMFEILMSMKIEDVECVIFGC